MRNKKCCIILLLLALAAYGCSSSPEFVSQQSVEDKIARVKLGETTRNEVEAIFGAPQVKDKRLWAYNFTDTDKDFREVKSAVWAGLMPPLSLTVPTNTRALVTLRFDDADKVKGLEVSRYFSEPYTHDYWYLVKGPTDKVVQAVAGIGERNGFKVTRSNETPNALKLEEPGSKASMTATLDNQTLHLMSNNPYDRLSTEYRIFVKRETAFIDNVSSSESLD
jgi:hypothetical protein